MRISDLSSDVCSSDLLRFRNLLATLLDHLHGLLDLFDMLEHRRAIKHRDTLRTGWRRGRKAPDRHSRQDKLLHSLTPFSLGAGAGEIPATRASDRKSTRLNSITNAHLVCRLLLEKKNKRYDT